ncbi:hypothetical protein SDC9_173842 [bioreactor metagenome]|uniref:Uncharacterized protein n=1 Tax=bioreactor metagenome TaxID=1076179 RepID=A0A645GHK8_9ZZZZ
MAYLESGTSFEVMFTIYGPEAGNTIFYRGVSSNWVAAASTGKMAYLAKGTKVYLGVFQGSTAAKTLTAGNSNLGIQFLHV